MKQNYVYFYNKNAAFYNAHVGAKRVLKFTNFALTWLFFIAYGVLWTQAMNKDKHRTRARASIRSFFMLFLLKENLF